jgi:hypothetical protein
VIILFLLFLAGTQDLFTGYDTVHVVLGMLTSVGTTTFLLIMGLRRWYRRAPLATVVVVGVVAFFFTFVAWNGVSASVFTLFLPVVAMVLAVWSVRIRSRWRVVPLALPLLTAFFLNVILPGCLSEEKRRVLLLQEERAPLEEVRVGKVTVRYNGEALREIALKMGKVIDAANCVSREVFGISPEVNELVLTGLGPGGFHGGAPGRIVGKIISREYLKRCDDARLFLQRGTFVFVNISCPPPERVSRLVVFTKVCNV